jgi:hypothetical protein
MKNVNLMSSQGLNTMRSTNNLSNFDSIKKPPLSGKKIAIPISRKIFKIDSDQNIKTTSKKRIKSARIYDFTNEN